MKLIDKHNKLPLVYSCSGGSSAAQMANNLAIALDRKKIAKMSCIVGVGGDVESLVKIAKSGRSIVGIDGCPLACVKNCLAKHDLSPDIYYILSEYGIKKELHADYDENQESKILEKIIYDVAQQHSCNKC